MANYQFFLSYATDDADDPWLKKFYEELVSLVQKHAGIKAPLDEIGFYGGESIRNGDTWKPVLTEGLQSSKVLVCLISPNYVVSEYCGKEFNVFHSRWKAHAAKTGEGLPRPPVILPIRWIPVADESLPPVLSEIQNTHDDYGVKYATEGLYEVRIRHRGEYQKFLFQFAKRLVQVAKNYSLERLDNLSSVDDVPSLFHAAGAASVPAAAPQANKGPKVAQFVIVAAQPSDFQKDKVKESLECYSAEGVRHWRPYLPEAEDDIGLMAQSIATRENFQSDVLPVGKNLIPLLREAERNKKIVILIVDSWTLLLRRYRSLMRKYDAEESPGQVVLVLWNGSDPETALRLKALKESVFKTFSSKVFSKDPASFFRCPVTSRDELIDELGRILQRARMKIIQSSDAVRLPEGETIAKPEIKGPVGK